MKALVVYDTKFGNTEKIAHAIGAALAATGEVAVVKVGDVQTGQMAGMSLLLVGSPTWGGRPTPAINRWARDLSRDALKGVRIAGFDTRGDMSQVKSPFVNWLVSLFGTAAARISDTLSRQGGTVAIPPAGFIVLEREGPLKDGELERAAKWARRLAAL